MKGITRRRLLSWLLGGSLAGVAYGAGSVHIAGGLASFIWAPLRNSGGSGHIGKEVSVVGTMPYHLEKGVIGLRMDYLTQSTKVRDHVLSRLASGEDPFAVAQSIDVNGITVNVFGDKKPDFAAKLDQLLGDGAGDRYLEHQETRLYPRNQDTTGNRDAFIGYWILASRNNPDFKDTLRRELIVALGSGRPIDYWWDCTLPDGAPATVKTSLDLPEVARVFFRTDHGPVEPEDSPAREPFDT